MYQKIATETYPNALITGAEPTGGGHQLREGGNVDCSVGAELAVREEDSSTTSADPRAAVRPPADPGDEDLATRSPQAPSR